jgi:hypothetical protein
MLLHLDPNKKDVLDSRWWRDDQTRHRYPRDLVVAIHGVADSRRDQDDDHDRNHDPGSEQSARASAAVVPANVGALEYGRRSRGSVGHDKRV